MMNLFWAASVLAVGIRLEELEQTLESDSILSFGHGILLFWWLKMGECSWRVFPEGCDACEWTPVFHLTSAHEPHCRNNTRSLAKSPKQHLPSSMPSDDVPETVDCVDEGWVPFRMFWYNVKFHALVLIRLPEQYFLLTPDVLKTNLNNINKNTLLPQQQKEKKVLLPILTESVHFFRRRWGCTEHIQQGAQMQQEPREAETSRAENSRPSSETVRKKYFFHQSSCFQLYFNL